MNMQPTQYNRVTTFSALAISIALASQHVLADDDYGEEIPFDVASLYFELNDTDGDLGIHGLIDGEPWKQLQIEDPREKNMLKATIQGRLRKQGMTEFFFESAEPTFDELDPSEFFERFPEGWYEVEGVSLEGDELESEVFLSHVIPAPAAGITVSGEDFSDDCDEDVPTVSSPIVISWDPVTSDHPSLGASGSIEVERYQLVVEIEEPETYVYSVELPPGVTELSVPEAFIDLGEEFKYEILVRATNGNQTAVESCFEVE